MLLAGSKKLSLWRNITCKPPKSDSMKDTATVSETNELETSSLTTISLQENIKTDEKIYQLIWEEELVLLNFKCHNIIFNIYIIY